MQLVNGTSAVPFDIEFVKTISEAVVGGAVSEQTAEAVLTHLNCVLRLILISAKDNRVACGRTEISVEDIRIAMKDLGVGTCLGFELEHRANFRATMALPHESKAMPKNIDELVPEIISSKVMADVTIKSHWLAIDGIQPAIPENPVMLVEEEPVEVVERPAIKRKPGPLLIKEAARKMPKTEQVQIKTTTTHTLSVEQQIFFKEIMETIMGSDEPKRTEAIHCLRTDPGLQPLIPRFSNAIAEGVRCNLIQETVAFLIYLMRIIEAFVQNSTINIEKCLHELIPPIISCLVVRSPGIDVGPKSASWTLREFCAKLLHKIVHYRRYKIPQLKERLVRVFANAFTRRDPYLPTLYGVIFAINLFGAEVIENVLFPNLGAVKNAINSYRPINERRYNQEKTQQERANGLCHEQQKLTDLVMKIATTYANSERMTDKGMDTYRDLFGPFAEEVYCKTASDGERQQYYSGRNY